MYKIICNQEGDINYGIDQSSSRCIWRNNGRSVEGVFYCDAIDKDVLVVKGEKRVGGRSSNKKGSDNIISSGSGIAVADGQCMIIVEQERLWRFVQNPDSLPMMHPQNQVFLPEVWERGSTGL